MNVLCVVAHPDDESFFCGGTLAWHALEGDAVFVATLTDGVGSRFRHGRGEGEQDAAHGRRQSYWRALKALGVKGSWGFAFPDQQADAVYQVAINDYVRCVIDELEQDPDIVYTHHVGDLNVDHRRVAEAVLVETRGMCKVRCMTPEWPERCVGPAFVPNMRVEYGPVAKALKLTACQCYEAELRPYPHPRSIQAVREERAESFMEIR